jgi:nucleoid DNA-binding protein
MAAAKSAKKAAVKKASTKKQAPAKNIPAAKTAMTKSAILDEIAGNTGLSKKQVSSVFDELTTLIERHIKKGAVGQFALPGLMKIEVKRKPATKARKGINPFHRRGNHVQGQAGQECRQDPAVEEGEGYGEKALNYDGKGSHKPFPGLMASVWNFRSNDEKVPKILYEFDG